MIKITEVFGPRPRFEARARGLAGLGATKGDALSALQHVACCHGFRYAGLARRAARERDAMPRAERDRRAGLASDGGPERWGAD